MKSIILFLLYLLCTCGGGMKGENQEIPDGSHNQDRRFGTIFVEMVEQLEEKQEAQDGGWNLLENSAQIEGRLVDVGTAELEKSEDYVTGLYIPVDENARAVLCTPGTNRFYLAYYDADKKCMGSEILLVTGGMLFSLPQNCRYVSISAKEDVFAKSIFVQEGQENIFVVSKEDTQYQSIKKAVASIEKEGVVIVFPGTYQENVKAWGKNVTIIGTDEEECILVNHSSNYYAPPLEISVGEVRNLTIQAKGRGDNSKPGAYGVHVEDDSLYGNSLIFENCIIESESNSAVGIGMRGGCDVRFVNCVLTGKEDGLFCHDGAYKKYTGVQKLSLEDCIVEGCEGKQAVRFDSQGVTGAKVYVRFVNNTFLNKNNKSGENLLNTRNNGGRGSEENWLGLKNYYLDEESRENNIKEMNAN